MSGFYDNYLSLCALHKKSPSAVAVAIGLSRTSPNGWKKGKQPTEVNLKKLANYFGVTVAELNGEGKKENPTSQKTGEVDDVTMELLDIIQNGTNEDRQDLLEMYRIIKKRRETR